MTDLPRINEFHPSVIPDGHWIDCDGWEVGVKNGKYHRIDGPAIISTYGDIDWFLNGEWYRTFAEWLRDNDEITDEQRVMLKLEYG